MTAEQFQALPLAAYLPCAHWWVPAPRWIAPQHPGQVVLGCPACGQWWPLETN